MNTLDLFSGIGGFSLGLERAGFKTVAFCEIDPWCRRVLAKHWPGVPIYDDVRNLDAARLRADGIERIDAICGGFPCQDISLAGKGAGLEGERSGLWREYSRLLGELRPRYAIVENVGALRARGLAAVLADLAALGFDAEWHAIPAAAVGAPHLRDRVWIVAAAADPVCGGWGGLSEGRPVREAGQRGPAASGIAADADSLGVRFEPGRGEPEQRAGALLARADGEAGADPDAAGRHCPTCGFTSDRAGAIYCWYCAKAYPNPDGKRRGRQRQPQHRDEQGAPGLEPDGLGARGWRDGSAAANSAGRGSPQLRGLFGRLARSLSAASAPWPRAAEPPLRGVDDGIPAGLDGSGRARLAKLIRAQDRERTKALGNAVVPEIPELIGRALLEGGAA